MRRYGLAITAVIAAMAVCLGSATAQRPPPPTTGRPLESKPTTEVTSHTLHDSEIQDSAAAAMQGRHNPVARYRRFDIWWPGSVGEYARMARYTVMLLTVVTQKREELPIARLYIRAGGRELLLRKISSERSEYSPDNVVAQMFGRYREDAFYLVPGGALMHDGAVLADLTSGRREMGVVKLPTALALKRAKAFTTADPPPNARPNADTFNAFMVRVFPGFAVPDL